MEQKPEGRYVWVAQPKIEQTKEFLGLWFCGEIERPIEDILEEMGIINLLREITDYEFD